MTHEDLRFDLLRNAISHSDRLAFYEFWHKVFMFLIVAFGTAGVANILQKYAGPQFFAAITAIVASIDLVVDFKNKISNHSSLRKRYYILLSELEKKPISTENELNKIYSSMIKITADEPNERPMVDVLAYNRACDMLGRDQNYKFSIKWHERFLRHFCSYTSRVEAMKQKREQQEFSAKKK